MTTSRIEPLLSPDEVKAILATSNSVRHRGIKTEPETIDILASDRVIQQMLPALSVGFVRLSETLRKVLTSTLRMKVEVRDEAPEILTGRGLARVTEKAPCMLALRTTVFGQGFGFSILALDSKLTFCVIERVFGSGSMADITVVSRSPTSLEQRLLIRTLTPTVEAINRTLEPADSFRFVAERVESTLDLVPGFSPDITVLHVPFTMKIGEHLASMSLALPTGSLAPLRPILCPPLSESNENCTELPDLVLRVPVSVAVQLGHAVMTPRDVLNLQVGQVIPLDSHPADEIPVQVEGVVKFHGLPVHDNGAIAIEITRKSQ